MAVAAHRSQMTERLHPVGQAPSPQEVLEFQRDLYECTILLWDNMLKRMGTSCPKRANTMGDKSRGESAKKAISQRSRRISC